MPETALHRRLVCQARARVQELLPSAKILADLPESPGDVRPPKIDQFYPDLYAWVHGEGTVVIAEAKTQGLDSGHTFCQLSAFLEYLDPFPSGLLLLAVPGTHADRARTLLRMLQSIRPTTVKLAVFDELDIWFLESFNGTRWRLN